MAAEQPKAKPTLFQVTLYVEVPEGISPPHAWDWDSMINKPGTTKTPVRHVLSYPAQEGTA